MLSVLQPLCQKCLYPPAIQYLIEKMHYACEQMQGIVCATDYLLLTSKKAVCRREVSGSTPCPMLVRLASVWRSACSWRQPIEEKAVASERRVRDGCWGRLYLRYKKGPPKRAFVFETTVYLFKKR